MYNDLRDYVATLEANDFLLKVEGANLDLEMGVISELVSDREGPPLLFSSIPKYPKDYKILANPLSAYKAAILGLGWDARTDMDTALERYTSLLKNLKGIAPKVLNDGPVMENVLKGEDANLNALPTPKWHELDGGHYIGTGDAVIMRDPETSFVNVGTYRVQVYDSKTAGLFVEPKHHGDIIRRKYWAQGKPCPVAISLGHAPDLFVATACLDAPWGMSELDTAGQIRGAPYEVIIDPITGLPIPAHSEAVLVGDAVPEKMEEGPFGETFGYYAHGKLPEPTIKIRAIYHRNNPILLGIPPLRPLGPSSRSFGLSVKSSMLLNKLQATGIRGILDAWRLSAQGVTVVKIRQLYSGHVLQVGRAVAALEMHIGRFIVVVDEDVDIRDPNEVLWAMSTRCEPATDIEILPDCPVNALDPRVAPEKRKVGNFTGARVIINGCRPYEWFKQFPAVVRSSDIARKQVQDKWKGLFTSGGKESL